MGCFARFIGLVRASSWRPLRCAAVLVLCAPAWSADPSSLKETLGKVQSEAENKAVEDLISKLKGVPRVPAPTTAPMPTAAPSLPGGAPAVSPLPAPAQPPQAVPPTAPLSPKPDQVASPALPEPSPRPPAVEPEEVIKRAAQSQAPSIDLEIFFGYNSAEVTREAAAALMPGWRRPERLASLGRFDS